MKTLFTAIIDLNQVKAQQFLERMEKTIPWDWAVDIIKPYYERSGNIGRPQTEIIMLLKMMCLQQWYGLSDELVEDHATDRLSFREFLDIGTENPIDATTLCKFRKLLVENKLLTLLQERFTKKLSNNGVILKMGTCVDATIIESFASTKNQQKKRDEEMRHTKKGNKYHFGAKAHISLDQRTGLIKKVRVTPANIADSQVCEQLLDKEERAVFADKGYAKKTRKQSFRKKGIFCGILEKAKPKKSLSKSQKKKNKKLSRVRSVVEFPFGIWKHIWKYRKLRYKGIRKNSEHIHLLAFLSNLFTIDQKKLNPNPTFTG